MILEEISGGELGRIMGGALFLNFFSKNTQEMNIVQSWKKNLGFRPYIHLEHILFF